MQPHCVEDGEDKNIRAQSECKTGGGQAGTELLCSLWPASRQALLPWVSLHCNDMLDNR